MVNEEYKAIIALITASRDGESDILEKLHEWYDLDLTELMRVKNLENFDVPFAY